MKFGRDVPPKLDFGSISRQHGLESIVIMLNMVLNICDFGPVVRVNRLIH